MKLFSQLFALSLLISLYSCSKETDIVADEPVVPTNQTLQTMPQVEDGMLTFSNMESFQKAMVALGSMGMEERTEWEKNNGFESMQTLCETLSEQLLNVETIEEYWQIRSRYDNNVFFNEPGGDNQAFDIPLEKMGYLPIVNVDGNVKIAGEVSCLKVKSKSLLKSKGDDLDHCKKFRSKDVQILCLLEEWWTPSDVQLYISTQKHHWYSGWINNASARTFVFWGPTTRFTLDITIGAGVTKANGESFTTRSELYTKIQFVRDFSSTYKFEVFGNGFKYGEGCTLQLY
jgi:hypothetical protein